MRNPSVFSFIVLFLFLLSCSDDEMAETEMQVSTTCDLLEFSCNVPFQNNANTPNIPNTTQITVLDTSLEAVQQALLQINESHRSVFFPAGIYKIPVFRNAQNQISNRTILGFNAINNLEIFGEAGTVFQLDFEGESTSDLEIIRQKQVALVSINDSENIFFHDIELKGNFEFSGDVSDTIDFYTEHRNILIRDSKSVYVYNVKSTKAEGDGISIVASVSNNGNANFTSDIFVTNTEVNNLNRNGISIAGSGILNNIFISQCNFGSKIRTQQLDVEPTENASNSLNMQNVDIWDNSFNVLETSSNALSQGAISILTRQGVGIACVSIRENNIKNDIQLLRGASNISLMNNTNIPSLVITNNANNINISDNNFKLQLPLERSIQRLNSGIVITKVTDNSGYFEPAKVIFADNTFEESSVVNTSNIDKVISVFNADDVVAFSNTFSFNSISTIGFLIDFEFNSGFQNINFISNSNEFQGISAENQTMLSGEITQIFVSEDCN